MIKGKWGFKRPYDKDDNYSSIESENSVICLLPEPHFMPDCGDTTWYNGNVESMKATARLISASPDMYEALELLLRRLKELDGKYPMALELPKVWAERAIAKAEGK